MIGDTPARQILNSLKAKKKNKYNVGAKEKRTVDNITFDSIKEAKRYRELKLAQQAGNVIMFLLQPRFETGGGTKYRADFQVFWANGDVTFEDVKGRRTKDYIRAKKQVEALYPVEILEK